MAWHTCPGGGSVPVPVPVPVWRVQPWRRPATARPRTAHLVPRAVCGQHGRTGVPAKTQQATCARRAPGPRGAARCLVRGCDAAPYLCCAFSSCEEPATRRSSPRQSTGACLPGNVYTAHTAAHGVGVSERASGGGMSRWRMAAEGAPAHVATLVRGSGPTPRCHPLPTPTHHHARTEHSDTAPHAHARRTHTRPPAHRAAIRRRCRQSAWSAGTMLAPQTLRGPRPSTSRRPTRGCGARTRSS